MTQPEDQSKESSELLEESLLIQWQIRPHWADFKVFEVAGMEDTPEGPRMRFGLDGERLEPQDEDLYLKGHIKWDGCSQFQTDGLHLCGLHGYRLHVRLLQRLWNRAHQLMDREPEDDWWPTSIDTNESKK